MGKIGSALVLCMFATSSGAATQLVLSPTSVIGSSGSYSASFAANNILDEQLGAVTDVSGSTYWLNPDNTGGASVFITIDLGQAYVVSSLDLFNTHNAQWFDRGTGAFSILAGNAVADVGGGTFALTGPVTTLASGVLVAAVTNAPLAQSFAVSDIGSYRYLSFRPTGASALNTPAGPTAYGLNELRVFASPVPELSQWEFLLIGAAVVGWASAHHRRARSVCRDTLQKGPGTQ